MIEALIPKVRPKEKVWRFCERLAEEHKTTPLEVLKRLIQIGECVANIEERGGTVTGRVDGREISIEFFKYS